MLSPADKSLLAFLEGPPVCACLGTEFTKAEAGPLYQRVAQWYQKNGCATVDAPSIGPVLLDERAVTRSIRHGVRLNRAKTVGFIAVPKVLLHGRIIHEEPLRGSSTGRVYYVAAPIVIGAADHVAVVMVKKEQSDKDRFCARMYLHSVLDKERLRHSAKTSGVGIGFDGRPYDSHTTEAGAIWTLLVRLYQVNPEASPHTTNETQAPAHPHYPRAVCAA